MKNNWLYDIDRGWCEATDRPTIESDIPDGLKDQGYFVSPDFIFGDEFNFIAVFEHPGKEEYLFHLVMDEFCKVLYANSLPAMLKVLKELTDLLNAYFDTLAAVNDGDENVWIEEDGSADK